MLEDPEGYRFIEINKYYIYIVVIECCGLEIVIFQLQKEKKNISLRKLTFILSAEQQKEQCANKRNVFILHLSIATEHTFLELFEMLLQKLQFVNILESPSAKNCWHISWFPRHENSYKPLAANLSPKLHIILQWCVSMFQLKMKQF